MTTIHALMRHPYRVPRVEHPRAEGRFTLPDGRRLGFAEFGDPKGDTVLWFHGTPGGRRQFPLCGRPAALDLGLRVVVLGRPGSGLSDPHAYEAGADWAHDINHVADILGAESLSVVAAAGPTHWPAPPSNRSSTVCRPWPSLAASSRPSAPTPWPPAPSTAPVASLPCCTACAAPSPGVLATALTPALPLAHYACRAYAATTPAGDRRVLHDPEVEGMFIDDLVLLAKGSFQAIVDDARLFGRHCGFHLADADATVRWWHGDSDHIVPLAGAQKAVELLPHATLILRAEESHLGGFATTDEVLHFIRSQF